ncbi:MAG: SPOR domain-containing protein [Myxococcales bacterium]|nr:SPOR domain-containing protein [Myxococcales bacterium]
MPRGVAVALVVLGGACVAFAALALGGRTAGPVENKADPLGDLLASRSRASSSQSSGAAGSAATELAPRDVTFPRLLSDDDHPPTALAAVRPGPRSSPAVEQQQQQRQEQQQQAGLPGGPPNLAAAPEVQPPPPTDRLSVVPLPAQAVLEASPLLTRPRDPLTKAASDVAKMEGAVAAGGDAAPAGHEGGYQLQVSSFHTEGEAQSFAQQLRARGHKAYVVEATVPGRGTWYRVRIGPFGSQRAAADYRASFEEREHVVPFIVIPESTGRGR